mmetsp:Transcript_18180/g.22427  ORF Transcript_18180/g.22427 Transcript_18180/m.22427 type:complete len:183 (-) Transcript_18180:95-643(-)
MSLPNKEYLEFTELETSRCLLAILDVVLAYAYDLRITQGESNVESAWTIRKLSSTLSWLDEFENAQEVGEAFIHRVLTYPYMRNCDIGLQVIKDVGEIFAQGKRTVLRCLLQTHQIFNKSESMYLLNRLYVTDMCVWLQKLDDASVSKLAYDIKKVADEFNIAEQIRWNLGKLVNEALCMSE